MFLFFFHNFWEQFFCIIYIIYRATFLKISHIIAYEAVSHLITAVH